MLQDTLTLDMKYCTTIKRFYFDPFPQPPPRPPPRRSTNDSTWKRDYTSYIAVLVASRRDVHVATLAKQARRQGNEWVGAGPASPCGLVHPRLALLISLLNPPKPTLARQRTNADQGFSTTKKFQPENLTNQKTAGRKCLFL